MLADHECDKFKVTHRPFTTMPEPSRHYLPRGDGTVPHLQNTYPQLSFLQLEIWCANIPFFYLSALRGNLYSARVRMAHANG